MAVKSLKNLDSFSRGYIEGRTTKVDFNTTLTGEIKSIYRDITSVTITNGDTNVTSATVTFYAPIGSDGSGSSRRAEGTAIIENGSVTGVNITDAGARYTEAPDILIVTDGDLQIATGTVNTDITEYAVDNDTSIYFTEKLIRNEGLYNEIKPQIGQVVSGPGIIGIPKVIAIGTARGYTEITVDIPQTLDIGVRLTISDTSSGLNEYELTGNTLSRSKEDLRIDQIVPSELLNYASDSNYDNNTSGGIKAFIDAYYNFMNTEEFVYNTIETFDDIVLNNVATIRIPDPDLQNNRFFSLEAARSAQFLDDQDHILTVGDNSTDYDINYYNIEMYNVDNLPSETALKNNSGRTLSITGLPTRLNSKKIKVKTSIQTYVISNPSFRLNTLEDALNINENDEKLLDMMQKEIAPAINHDIKVNKRALYQRIIDFYKIRGSKESIDTFFKLFFQDEEINIEYPWDSTLKPSTGNWDPQQILSPQYNKRSTALSALDGVAGDEYGSSVSLDAITNLLAVGAPGESSDEGAVYTYTTINSGFSYTDEFKIEKTGGATGDKFGSVVSLSNNLVAISAPGDTAGITNVRPNLLTNSTFDTDVTGWTGTADHFAWKTGGYLERIDDDGLNSAITQGGMSIVKGEWYQLDVDVVHTSGSNTTSKFYMNDGSGMGNINVSRSGSGHLTHTFRATATATIEFRVSFGTDFRGYIDNASMKLVDTGTVEIWERVLTQAPSTFEWQYRTKLLPPSAGDASRGLKFGTDISLDGNTLAIGVPGYVNGDRSDGAILIYKGVGSAWTLSQTIITPLDSRVNVSGQNGWGEKVVIRGDMLMVSWPNGNYGRGSVSIFHINHSTGLFNTVPEVVLAPDDLTMVSFSSSGAQFGTSIDIDTSDTTERICAVGAPGMRAVYTFEREIHTDQTTTWVTKQKLQPTDDQTADLFGSKVKIYNNNILVGAPDSDGIDQTTISDSGIIYHFENGTSDWSQKATYSEDQTVNHKFGSAFDISRNHRYDLLIGSPFTSTGGHVINFLRPYQQGKYLNNHGFISDKQKIQDSDFYQKFSYVIKSGRNISQWKDTYNKLVHPAGFKYFGEILVVIKAVRDILGDNNRQTTITEKVKGVLEERVVQAYTASSQIRKTLSSMPGVQIGYLLEDLLLLVESFAAVFNPTFRKLIANRDAKLDIIKMGAGGGLPYDAISIIDSGSGYKVGSNPRVKLNGTLVTDTESESNIICEVDSQGQIANIVIQGGHTLVQSTPSSSGAFSVPQKSNTEWVEGTYTGITTALGSRARGDGALTPANRFNGSGGIYTIVVDANNKIESVAVTAVGKSYEVGDEISIIATDLGGASSAPSDYLTLTVNQTLFGSGYDINTTIGVQGLSEVTGSGVKTSLGKALNAQEFFIGITSLQQYSFYRIVDRGDLTSAEINDLTTLTYRRDTWAVGDSFMMNEDDGGLIVPGTSTTKVREISEYDSLIGTFGNKKYKLPPIITIGPPTARDFNGDLLVSNTNATGRIILDNSISLDNTARLNRTKKYTITYKGDATDAQFNSISFNKTKTNWKVGDSFIASGDGTAVGSATTATVALYNHGGKINEFRITNTGLGYITPPDIDMKSNSLHEKRVPDLTHKSIVTNGNEIQTTTESGAIKTSINRTNNYFNRKDYSQKAILGTKRFNGEYNISQFAELTIENVGESTINKNNVTTTIQTNTDRNT